MTEYLTVPLQTPEYYQAKQRELQAQRRPTHNGDAATCPICSRARNAAMSELNDLVKLARRS